MNDTNFLQNLHLHGFSSKEISKLKEIVQQDNDSYQSVLIDLKRRFIAACILLIVLSTFYISKLISTGGTGMLPFTLTVFFVYLVAYVLTPLKLGAKAFFYLRKN